MSKPFVLVRDYLGTGPAFGVRDDHYDIYEFADGDALGLVHLPPDSEFLDWREVAERLAKTEPNP